MFVEVVDTYITGQVQLRFLWYPEMDDIKLMAFDDCDQVKYCGEACERERWPQHEEACEKKGGAELREELLFQLLLRDERLFKQPESTHMGDCPICMIPLPLDRQKSIMYACCSKIICNGCVYVTAIKKKAMWLLPLCPFCREPATIIEEEQDKRHMKRVEANDPEAMCHEGKQQYEKGDYRSAFKYFTKAAELGDAEAHYQLSLLYHEGEGVDKDKEKEIHHYEEAAIGGHPRARYNLGACEWNNGNPERSVKHWIIAATQGHDESINAIMKCFKEGLFVGKDVLDATLRAHKAAVDATRSPQREEAEEFEKGRRGRC